MALKGSPVMCIVLSAYEAYLILGTALTIALTGRSGGKHVPKDEVNPVVQICGSVGALKGSPVACLVFSACDANLMLGTALTTALTGRSGEAHIPKDEVNPVVQVCGDKGAFQGGPVLCNEVLRAAGPGWQLHCIH